MSTEHHSSAFIIDKVFPQWKSCDTDSRLVCFISQVPVVAQKRRPTWWGAGPGPGGSSLTFKGETVDDDVMVCYRIVFISLSAIMGCFANGLEEACFISSMGK